MAYTRNPTWVTGAVLTATAMNIIEDALVAAAAIGDAAVPAAAAANGTLFYKNSGGVVSGMAYATAATANTMALRDAAGALTVGTPTATGHAVTKAYTDATFALVGRAIATSTGLTGGGTLVADRTIALNAASIASLAKADTAVQPATMTTALATKADLVGGVIPTSQIPSIALGTSIAVASRAAMLALTATQVQPGDLAIDTSTPGASSTRGTYQLVGVDPSVIGNWNLLNANSDAVQSVNAQTGTVVLGKADVGLSNVDNTADSAKPVSTPQLTALNLKAPLASPAFTGTPTGITKAHVGLANVDNTSDVNKPVSTAQATAIGAKYTKPAAGIPATDLTSTGQASLAKADSSVQRVNGTAPDAYGNVTIVATGGGNSDANSFEVAPEGLNRGLLNDELRLAMRSGPQFVKKLQDSFVAANGTAPSTTNYTLQKPTGAVIDIQTNRLHVQLPATDWVGGAEVFVAGFKAQNMDIEFLYTWTPTQDQYEGFAVRAVTPDQTGNGTTDTGYTFTFNTLTKNFQFIAQYATLASGVLTNLPTTGSARVRIRIIEQTFSIKFTDSTKPEAEAWDWVYSDPNIDTNWGTFAYIHGNGDISAVTNTYITDLVCSAIVPLAPPVMPTVVPTATTIVSGGHIWNLSYTNDFNTNAALGAIRTAYPNMGYATEEEGDTATAATSGKKSANKTITVANSILDIYQHIEGTTPYGAFIMPDNYAAHTYARYAIRFKTVQTTGVGGYKFVPLMWPVDNDWNKGEIDWPEAGLTEYPRPASAIPGSYGTVAAGSMVFRPLAEFYAQTDTSDWHIAEMEWVPGAIRCYWDGILVATITDAVPTTPMRFTLQAETWINDGAVPVGASGHVMVDWVAVWDLA